MGLMLGALGARGLGGARATDGLDGLADAFARIEAARGGRLGVAALDVASGRTVGHRLDERFPLGSTYKLLAAGAVLARVDAGRDGLERRLRFAREDLVPYSPVTETQAGGGDGMTLAALCEAAVVWSDNTAGNLLLAALDGPAGLTGYLRDGLGDGVTRLDRIEPELNEARPDDPRDTTSPAAMLGDLRAFTSGAALSPASAERLRAWLRGGRTGDARLRAGLPRGWTAGEKTGTAAHGTSNDVGLLWPPNRAAPVLVAAYLTEGPAEGAARDAALAEMGAAIAAAFPG